LAFLLTLKVVIIALAATILELKTASSHSIIIESKLESLAWSFILLQVADVSNNIFILWYNFSWSSWRYSGNSSAADRSSRTTSIQAGSATLFSTVKIIAISFTATIEEASAGSGIGFKIPNRSIGITGTRVFL